MFFYGTQRTTHPLIDPRAWEAPVLQQYKISGYSPKNWGGNDGLLLGEGCKVHGRLRNDGRASRDNLKRLGACALSPCCLVLLGHWDEPSRTAVFADDPASENVQDGACYMVGFMKDHFPSIIAKSTHPEGDTEQRSEPWIAEAGKEVHPIHLRYKIARAIIQCSWSHIGTIECIILIWPAPWTCLLICQRFTSDFRSSKHIRRLHTESKVVFNIHRLLLWVGVIPCGICRLLAFFVSVESIDLGKVGNIPSTVIL